MQNAIKSQELDRLLSEIRIELKAVLPLVEGLVVFGSARDPASHGDLDLAIIIPDDINTFEASLALAPILARFTTQAGRLVSCFPIGVDRFHNDTSQFIQNVRTNGRTI